MASISSRTYTVEQALNILSEGTTRLTAATTNVDAKLLRKAPGPDEWSANDVLALLRACSDMWGGYMRRIIAEDKPSYRAVSPRTYINQTDYPQQEFKSSLQAFTAQRADLLALLRSLPQEGWARSAMVTGVGKPLERTVLDYADRLARHERDHVKQIEQIVKRLRE